MPPSSFVSQDMNSWVYEGSNPHKIVINIGTMNNKLKVGDDETEPLNVEIKTAYTLTDLLIKRAVEPERKETKLGSLDGKLSTQEKNIGNSK